MNIENEKVDDDDNISITNEIMSEMGMDDNLNETDDPELLVDEDADDDEVVNEDLEEDDVTPDEPTETVSVDTDAGNAVDETEDTSESENDDDLEDDENDSVFRQEFAERYGFDENTVANFEREQLEQLGMDLDRKAIESLQQQAPQQQFQQQQQPMPQQPEPVDIESLRQQALDEGLPESFMNGLDGLQQQFQSVQQQNDAFLQYQHQQQELAIREQESSFDKSLESLELPEVFGEDRDSAFKNGIQFEARKKLFQTAQQFSVARNEPMTQDLISRTARILFSEQLDNKEKQGKANKARKQHNSKLGTGKSRTRKQKTVKPPSKTGDEQVDEVLEDPEMVAFAEANNILMD